MNLDEHLDNHGISKRPPERPRINRSRIKIFQISMNVLLGILNNEYILDRRTFPRDAKILRARYDWDQDVLEIVVHSGEYNEVPDGVQPPIRPFLGAVSYGKKKGIGVSSPELPAGSPDQPAAAVESRKVKPDDSK